MNDDKQQRPEGQRPEDTPAKGEGVCSPGATPTPRGKDPGEIVSSGGSGNVRTPPSGRLDDARESQSKE